MPKTKEQNEKIKKQMKERIIHDSILYFARNGFAGTKIGDLAKYIGIGQGTMYLYFKSKEALFDEIKERVLNEQDITSMKVLTALPIKADKKITRLSETVLKKLKKDDKFASTVALSTQMVFEEVKDSASRQTTYQSELYKLMERIIIQGQIEGTVVAGNPIKLVDYYWGVVYLYAIKCLFTSEFDMIDVSDLNRTVLK